MFMLANENFGFFCHSGYKKYKKNIHEKLLLSIKNIRCKDKDLQSAIRNITYKLKLNINKTVELLTVLSSLPNGTVDDSWLCYTISISLTKHMINSKYITSIGTSSTQFLYTSSSSVIWARDQSVYWSTCCTSRAYHRTTPMVNL